MLALVRDCTAEDVVEVEDGSMLGAKARGDVMFGWPPRSLGWMRA